MRKVECVLVVDDDPVAVYLNKSLIQKLELAQHIDTASNGKTAIEKVEQYIKTSGCPNIIFLDINMPVMDGFEFIRNFNQLDIENKESIKIIVVTSSQNPADIEKMESMGVTRFITKPLKKEAVLQNIA